MECTFVIASTSDVTYMGAMLASPALPDLRHAVTKLQFPNLRVMTITLHPAGLTNHRWAEREMLEMERTNLEGSKERILLPLGEVVRFFEFNALSDCAGLLSLHLEYIESPMVAHFCKAENPVEVFYALRTYLEQRFARTHRHEVTVTSNIVTGQIEGEDN